jgi:hypothetical protein
MMAKLADLVSFEARRAVANEPNAKDSAHALPTYGAESGH